MNIPRIRIGTGGSGTVPLGRLLLGGAGVAVLAGIVLLSLFGGLLLLGVGLLASGITAAVAALRHHFPGQASPPNQEPHLPPDHRDRLEKWREKRVGEIIDVEESEVTILPGNDSRRR